MLKDIARREPDARCDTEGRVFEQDHCESKPVADECIGILDLFGCWVANNTADCLKCVQELDDELKRLRCTPREEAAYCGGPEPIPGPVSQPCQNDLIKACEPFGGNHGTVRACDKCTLNANVTTCTKEEELSFCLPAPPFKPSETSCESYLMTKCEMEQKNPTACIACVKKAVEPSGSTNCSHREEEVFCAHRPQPPGPAPAPPPGPATARFSCNSTLGVCSECPPDDPEKPPWAQQCKQFTFNQTACAEACFKPTPPGQHWVCNTETHKCEAGPYEPHFQTHLLCEQSCRPPPVSGFTCLTRNGHASCERTHGGDHKTIAECTQACQDQPGYHGYHCNATTRTCGRSSVHNASSELCPRPSPARVVCCSALMAWQARVLHCLFALWLD